MSGPLAVLSVEVAAIVCAALLGLRALASRPRLPGAQLIALIAFDTICAVVLGHQDYGYWIPPAFRIDVGPWAPLLNLARNLTPALFMLLCFTLFTEGRRFPRVLLVLVAVQLCLEEPARAVVPPAWRYARAVTQTAPALLQTLFVAFALYWTVADWRVDLVERRRRARALTLAAIGLVTVASSVLTRVLIDPASRASYLAHVWLTVAYLAVLAYVLMRLTEGDIGRHLDFGLAGRPARPPRGPIGPPIEAPPEAPPDWALARLGRLLEDERVCLQEGLTLKVLADRVGLPEYRLRRLIHEELGYRNFNALLHDYRIREACAQLADPGRRRTPILTIALSVGYSSVNTFNRGFREIMRVTPSAYRAAELAAAFPGAERSVPENE